MIVVVWSSTLSLYQYDCYFGFFFLKKSNGWFKTFASLKYPIRLTFFCLIPKKFEEWWRVYNYFLSIIFDLIWFPFPSKVSVCVCILVGPRITIQWSVTDVSVASMVLNRRTVYSIWPFLIWVLLSAVHKHYILVFPTI